MAHISIDFPVRFLYIELMIRKVGALFAIYLFLNILNLFLIDKAFVYANTRKDFTKVLGEISDRRNNAENYQFTASYKADLSKGYTAEIKPGDARAINLKIFFRKHNSDLYNHAEKIIEVSDKYGFDYRLLPAIAMQESNLCRVIPDNSYNCWGWGIYGDKVTRFDSFEEAIRRIAPQFKEIFLQDNHSKDPFKVMRTYTPPSDGSWAAGINQFFSELQ